jgi:hypothetical protein
MVTEMNLLGPVAFGTGMVVLTLLVLFGLWWLLK